MPEQIDLTARIFWGAMPFLMILVLVGQWLVLKALQDD